MNKFATHVRHTRHEAGLTQDDLAARVGTTRSAIAAVEGGHRAPSRALIGGLCHALNLGHPWPATAFIEAYAAKQLRDFNIAPADTFAEIKAAASHGGYLVFEPDAID